MSMIYFCLHTPSILNDTGKHFINGKAREQLSAIPLRSPDLLPFKGGSFKNSCRLSAGFSASQCSLFVCLQRNLPGSHCPGSIKIVCAVIDHLKACNHGIVLA